MRRFADAADRGWFIVKAVAVVIALTLIGLILDGVGLDVGAYVVLAAVAVFIVVTYILPWWPSRR